MFQFTPLSPIIVFTFQNVFPSLKIVNRFISIDCELSSDLFAKVYRKNIRE